MHLEELVKLVESRADELTELMVRKVRESPPVSGYESVGGGPVAHRHPEEAPFWPGG